MADFDLSRPGQTRRGGATALLIVGAIALLTLIAVALMGPGDGASLAVPPVDGAAPDAAPVATE